MGVAIVRKEKLKKICSRIAAISFEDLKNEFRSEFDIKLKVENESVSSRLKKFNNPKVLDENDKRVIRSVIDNLQDKTIKFSGADANDLDYFTTKINTLIRGTNYSKAGIADRIALIKNGSNNVVKGHSIDIVQLFNDFKKFDKFLTFIEESSLDKAFIENGTFFAHIRYLYSICKNCQDVDKYPFYYKQWQLLAKYFFGIERNDYDKFSQLYSNLSIDEPKSKSFGAYFHLLSLKLKADVEYNNLIDQSPNEKKQVELLIWADKYENAPEINDSLDIAEQFKLYLESKVASSSVNNYLSAVSFVDSTSVKIGFSEMYNWQLDEIQVNKDRLFANEEFKQRNISGNNMYTASVNHFHKFLIEMDLNQNADEIVTPVNKLPDYRWYWASSQPVLYFNRLDIICGVTKVIGEIGGKAIYNDEFKSMLVELENHLELDKTALSKSDIDNSKNVLASAREYWQGTGLIKTDNSLTDLGVKVANETMSEDQLSLELIRNVKLPNPNLPIRYTPEIIKKWGDFNLEITPLKLIIDILIELSNKYDRSIESYLSEDELVNIIIPIAADTPDDINKYCLSLIASRNGNLDYKDWPKYSSGGAEDKRLPKEFLVALKYWGYLEQLNIKGQNDVRYYLTNKARNIFGKPTVSQSILSKDNKPNDVPSSPREDPENKIYFGAPGTGKSYKIATDLKKKAVDKYYQRRITFHPDYDNASFLGAYKPLTDSKGDIKYEFSPQIFTNIFVDACNDRDNQYYLIIEEINRGNCAEIFGELFQLLDRDKNYPITPSDELIKYLGEHINNNTEYFINQAILLPDNITILATMNTSDQSLYPMDSAFKRRWDWEYIPIDYEIDKSKNESAKYFIKIEQKEVKWISFIEQVNKKISNNSNLGMDKCIGNYFVKPLEDGKITMEVFINKVLFYLWNDVFKDETKESIFKDEFGGFGKDLTYESFFPKKDGEALVKMIFKKLEILDEKVTTEKK